MDHQASDAELLRHARAGTAPAFAVLVVRYAPLLHQAAAEATGTRAPQADEAPGGATPEPGDPTALATVRTTFLRAMRRLDRADDGAVGSWLLELQGTPLEAPDTARAAPLATADLDRLWGELAPCWPRGRRPRRPPRWLGHVAIVLLLLVLSVAVPYALLVTAEDDEEDTPDPVEEVVAVPIQDDEFDLRFEDGPSDTDGGGADGSEPSDTDGAGTGADDDPDDA